MATWTGRFGGADCAISAGCALPGFLIGCAFSIAGFARAGSAVVSIVPV
jgi:hypothetical protein